jgi:hypothetical protein
MGRISSARQDYFLMLVTVLRQFIISSPSTGKNFRTFFDNLIDERDKAIAGRVGNPTHPNSSEALGRKNFNRDNHNFLAFTAPSSLTAKIATANVGLVNLNLSAELLSIRAHHATPEFVQPCPCSLVTRQTKNTFHPQSTRPVFLAGHKPNGGKPRPQRHPCTFKDGSCRHRNLASALPTMKRLLFDQIDQAVQSIGPTDTSRFLVFRVAIFPMTNSFT